MGAGITVDPNSPRGRRSALVDEHIAAENVGDIEGTLKTFARHPHYTMLGEEIDGADAVRAMLSATFASFDKFTFHERRRYHADDAVVVQGNLTAIHVGEHMGVAPTQRPIDVQAVAIFDFDGEEMVNETVFFDNAEIARQIQG